nr:MAG TPA_asm: hypothetical protein [Caudoviricetes sp.]
MKKILQFVVMNRLFSYICDSISAKPVLKNRNGAKYNR